MQELEEKSVNIFESIEFVFRHPWLFISPFVIILSVVFAKLSDIPPLYQADAVVSFETRGAGIIRKKTAYAQRIDDLTRKLLMGQGPRKIINEVWPDVNEKDNPDEYNRLRGWIRENVEMRYNSRENLMRISFKSGNPKLCYKVVQVTINALRKQIRESAKKKIEVGLSFLKKQEEYYGNKISAIDEEISSIKVELRKRAGELTDEERMLIGEITGERGLAIRDQAAMQKLAKYDEMLAELQLRLLEAQKKKESLQGSLETGRLTLDLPGEDPESDAYVKKYSKQIADKELAIVNFTLQGYLPEHPQIKKLEREIQGLKALRQNRIETLSEGKEERLIQRSETARKQAEARIKADLEELELEIATLKDKIDLVVKKYEEASPRLLEGSGVASELASRLKELREEKKISQGYYNNIRRQLGETELRTRVEEEKAGLNLVVVEKPQIPGGPIPFQKAPQVVWGFVIALFIGTGLAYIVESLDNSVKSAAELREFLHTPILGSVDRIASIGEVRLRVFRRNVVIISLIVFALSAKFLLGFRLFRLLFGFLK